MTKRRAMGFLLVVGAVAGTFACSDAPPAAPPDDTSSSSSSSSSSSGGTDGGMDRADADGGDLAPTVTITSPRDGVGTGARLVHVTGTAKDDVSVTTLRYVLGGAAPVVVTADPDGAFSFDVTPAPGDNVLVVTAEDSAGHTHTATAHVYFGHRLSVGNSQSAMLYDGQAFTWGRNELGQLGNGTLNGTWSADEAEEVPAMYALDVSRVTGSLVSIVTRQTFMLGLGANGAVYSWGSNDHEQLGRETPADCGNGGTSACARAPAAVPGLGGVVAVEAGFDHALVLRDDGTVLAFGSNAFGQLGPGDAAPRRTPAAVPGLSDIVQVAACAQTSMALGRDGHVWVWGRNELGQLGNGTTDTLRHPDPVQVAGIENAVAIAGANSTVMALLADGTVRAWGENKNGQVGSGTTEPVLVPVTVLARGGAALSDIESIAADGFVGMLIDHAGMTHTWGWGFLGQLGRGLLADGERNLENDPFAAPVVVPNGATAGDFVALEAEVGAGGPAFVLTKGGLVFGWGWSFQGSLGGGTALLNAWAYTSPILIHPVP